MGGFDLTCDGGHCHVHSSNIKEGHIDVWSNIRDSYRLGSVCVCVIPIVALDIFILGLDVALGIRIGGIDCLDGVTPGITGMLGHISNGVHGAIYGVSRVL